MQERERERERALLGTISITRWSEREIVIQIVDARERDIVDVRERDWASEREQMLVDGHICTKNIHFFT